MSQYYLELKPGMVLGNRYELTSFLGRGAFGAVFRARDRDLQIDCALKLLSPQWTGDSEHVQRFKHEIRIGRKIRHENVCQIYDFGEFQEIKFISMELVDGQTLTSRSQSEPSLSLPEKIEILVQICDALGAAHRAGVVHRDLKLDNVMLDLQGRVKVMDFGIARAGDMTRLTSGDKILGTTQYMPPEQWRGEEVDARADIYALGVMMYVLFAGRPPFEGSSHVALFYQHLNQPPPPLLSLCPELPPALAELAEACLAKDRQQRPSSTAAIEQELADIIAGRRGRGSRPTAVRPALVPAQPDGEPRGPSARGRVLAATFALGLIAVILGAAVVWLPGPEGPAATPSPGPTKVVSGPVSQPSPVNPTVAPTPQEAPTATAVPTLATSPSAPVPVATASPRQAPTIAPPGPTETSEPAEAPQELRGLMQQVEQRISAGDLEGALTELEDARVPSGPTGRRVRRLVERKIGEVRRLLASRKSGQEARPAPSARATGLVRLRVDVWARVRVDGQDAGTTPRPPLELPAGTHRIVLENPETEGRVERTVEVRAGETLTLEASLLYGHLEIKTEPPAHASVKLPDGSVRDLGTTPVTAKLPGGRDVQLLLEVGGKTQAFIVRVPGGARQTFRKKLQ